MANRSGFVMERQENRDVAIDRYVRERQLVGQCLPFSASTLWRKVRAGTFPAPVKLGPSITAWRERDVAEWLKAQGEES